MASDFIFYSGGGLILPAFAAYVTENIEGGDIMAVGIAAAAILLVIRNDFERFAGRDLYFSFMELVQRNADQ